MSSNYRYVPPPRNNTVDYHNSPYLGPYMAQTNSPFVPPMVLNASPCVSPYTTPYTSPAAANVPLPPSPNPSAASHLHSPYAAPFVPFPASADSAYKPYIPAYQRERRVSWNGPEPHADGTWTYPPRQPPVRQRTRSYNDSPYTIYTTPPSPVHYVPYTYNSAPPQATVEPALHPYLHGSVPRGDIIFDLAGPFQPMKLVGNNQVLPLTLDELGQNATHPPTYAMTISCDRSVPEWPLHLDFRTNNPHNASVPPIKLGDVLSIIHSSLNKRISQYDWATLDSKQEYLVSQAYTKRCKRLGPGELAYRTQGVKQLDFLLGKTKFRGLVPTGDSIESFMIVVSD
ncbi:hypothetical protein CPB83DRAFT_847518 [Crepidotus variabilis]|uniref:DUF6699 domain-containing protein n=1 Tax=Crepidotus variabilis TaxID=179855 RepID=A0A9P6ENJ0_9AGAR|nr:hypothetical protein CPB83DRAFT_847518 [Crepidotus variabilis]